MSKSLSFNIVINQSDHVLNVIPKFSVQAAAFAKAISVDVQEVSVIERVSLDSMPVEDGYDGPRLEGGYSLMS